MEEKGGQEMFEKRMGLLFTPAKFALYMNVSGSRFVESNYLSNDANQDLDR